MRSIRSFFFKTIIFSLLLTGAWFHYEYKKAKNRDSIQNEIDSGNWNGLLVRYEKLTPKKVSKGKTREGYYKALALEQTGNTDAALPYWKAILSTSMDTLVKGHAAYALGQNAQQQGDPATALTYFQNKALSAPTHPKFGSGKLAHANILIEQGELSDAKTLLSPLIKHLQSVDPASAAIKERLGVLNIQMTNSRRIYDNSVDYTIRPGDSLSTIAKKFHTTVEQIRKTNGLQSSVIRPRNHLKIVTSTFSLTINKKTNTLALLENGNFFKEYGVGTGKDNTTPIGNFKITGKQEKPTWYRPDGKIVAYGLPENLLGVPVDVN